MSTRIDVGRPTPDDLAIRGGPAAVTTRPAGGWPITHQEDVDAVLAVLTSGVLVSDRNRDGTAVEALERTWADYLGVGYCIGVSNGTTALEIGLLAEGVEPGDEVIVPALSFVATAMAVVHVGATPVYVDIDPVTFNLDPDQLKARLTARTRAVLPVHLHGLSAPMEEVEAFARAHGLRVVEDAAQAHGARDGSGRKCGGRGNTTAFSLQMTKNLPTCGEGGLIVTDDPDIADRARLLRQFGERIALGKPRRYISYRLGFNAKLSNVQAAYALSQLRRFDEYHVARRRQVAEFLDNVANCPGLIPPSEPTDNEHAWHILRFRLDTGHDPRRARHALMKALQAEGVPVSRYQVVPLPEQPALRRLTEQRPADWRTATRVIEESFTLQQRHLRPDAGPLLREWAQAFRKVFAHVEELAGER